MLRRCQESTFQLSCMALPMPTRLLLLVAAERAQGNVRMEAAEPRGSRRVITSVCNTRRGAQVVLDISQVSEACLSTICLPGGDALLRGWPSCTPARSLSDRRCRRSMSGWLQFKIRVTIVYNKPMAPTIQRMIRCFSVD